MANEKASADGSMELTLQGLAAMERRIRSYVQTLAREKAEGSADSRWHRKMELHAMQASRQALPRILEMDSHPALPRLWWGFVSASNAVLASISRARWESLRETIHAINPQRPPEDEDAKKGLKRKLDEAFRHDVAHDRILKEEHEAETLAQEAEEAFQALLRKKDHVHDHDLLRALAVHAWALDLRLWVDALLMSRDRSVEVSDQIERGFRRCMESMLRVMPANPTASPWGPLRKAAIGADVAIDPKGHPPGRPPILPKRPMAWLLPILRAQGPCFAQLPLEGREAALDPIPSEKVDAIAQAASEGCLRNIEDSLPEEVPGDEREWLPGVVSEIREHLPSLELALRLSDPGIRKRTRRSLARFKKIVMGERFTRKGLSQAILRIGDDVRKETIPFYEGWKRFIRGQNSPVPKGHTVH